MTFLYTLATVLCLGSQELYKDTRKQDVCIAASVFFFLSAVVCFSTPNLSASNAMFFNGFATFVFSSVLTLLRAHYLLLTVCFLGLCTHTFGYLIAISAVLVEISVYNNLVLTLDLLFVILLMALSDAGIRTYRRYQARYNAVLGLSSMEET